LDFSYSTNFIYADFNFHLSQNKFERSSIIWSNYLSNNFYFFETFSPKSHREGLKLTKEHKFEKAIPKFENSYKFFTQNNWIDKYRFITLLSSSKMNYREMALCNIAFCYSQIGNGQKSIEYYKKTLEEFPENGLAQTGLKMLTSTENK